MSELRWILLVAGLMLIAGIYAWGVRSRRGSRALQTDRARRLEPLQPPAPPPPARLEPEVGFAAESPDDAPTDPALHVLDVETYDDDTLPPRPGPAARREPRFEPRVEHRLEPALEPEPEPEPEPPPAIASEPAPEATRTRATTTVKPGRPPDQKIVAVCVVAPPGTQFEGGRLHEAILAAGFEFGRYDIFHRLDPEGRPVVSLASLKEPGTFDPPRMPGSNFRGVALFAVMPGPVPAPVAFDELIAVSRGLVGQLGGLLQDDRGAALSMQRIAHLREDVLAFERARAAAPGR